MDVIGINANNVLGNFKIASFVFDIMGFPEDNSAFYSEFNAGEFKMVKGERVKLKMMDKDYCSRDWLDEKLCEVFTGDDNRAVQLSKEGYFLNDIDETVVKVRLSNFIDWLYTQLI